MATTADGLVLLLAVLVLAVDGNSLGLNVPICDTDDPKIWKPKNAGGKYMYWCAAPKHTDDFSVRAGDGDKAQDATSYKPGGLVYIHVRALKQDLKYRGLLLYAQDDSGNKVGSWELPAEEEKMFHTPPGSCEGKAIFHSGADPKNFHNAFAFRAPPKGTGKVTFKCLLKTGPANTGAFHWPNKGGPLTLSESSTQFRQSWIEATASTQSCDQVCSAAGKSCSAAKMKNVKDEASFLSSIGKEHVCKRPILTDCSGAAPFQTSTDFCTYSGASCAAATCGSTGTGSKKRFCPCVGSGKLIEEGGEADDTWQEDEQWEEESNAAETSHKTAGCSAYYTEGACKAAGCVFSSEEGMVICTESKPL